MQYEERHIKAGPSGSVFLLFPASKTLFDWQRISTDIADWLMYHKDMTIYGEYLFLENFIVGLLLLMLTGRLAGRPYAWPRIIAGAVICGVSGFTIFAKLTAALDAGLRLTLLVMTVLATFGRHQFFKTTGLFMVLTFLSGGMIMALLLWQQEPAITHQGIVYIDIITYTRLLCFGILAFGFAYWFVRITRNRRAELQMCGDVCVIIQDREYSFKGFVDSGNSLKEPLSGRPVVLLDRSSAAGLNCSAEDFPERYAIVPYKAVGVEKGYLEAIRADRIIFKERQIQRVYVAFYQGEFEDYDILLSRDFLEGGLLENA